MQILTRHTTWLLAYAMCDNVMIATETTRVIAVDRALCCLIVYLIL